MTRYLPETEYSDRVSTMLTVPALLNVPPCPVTGRVIENEVKIALGQDWDIWSASILPDVA
jgi:hypothetical protein